MSDQDTGSSLAEIAEEVQEQVNDAVESEKQEEIGEHEEDDNTEEQEHEETKPKKSGFEKRVSKLNQKIELQRQEAEYWKDQALRNQQPQQKAIVQDEYQIPAKPTFAQYNDIDAYTDAVTDWKLLKLEVDNIKRTESQKQAQNIDTYNKRVAEYVKTNPDFTEAVAENGDTYCAPEIHEIAIESEVGPAIVYYLSKNVDEIDRINKLTPKRRLVELGKLEERLSKAQDAPSKVVVKTQRDAPAPIKSVKGAAVTTKSVYEMSPSELIAHRNKTVGHNR